MKKVWVLTLGILDILIGCLASFIVIYYIIVSSYFEIVLLLISLPAIIGIFGLVCGILTLKQKKLRWGVAGIVASSISVIYLMLLIFGGISF